MSDHEPLSGYNIPDRQAERAVTCCDNCGGELYAGDLAYSIGGRVYCTACVDAKIIGED